MNSEALQAVVALLMVAAFSLLFIALISANRKVMSKYLLSYLNSLDELKRSIDEIEITSHALEKELEKLKVAMFVNYNPLGTVELFKEKRLTNEYKYTRYIKGALSIDYFDTFHTTKQPRIDKIDDTVHIVVGDEEFIVNEYGKVEAKNGN